MLTQRSILREPSAAPGHGALKLRDLGAGAGAEKFCTRCTEWWPADEEFFFSDPEGLGGLFYCCKACYREWQLSTPTKSKRPRAPAFTPAPELASVPWLLSQASASSAITQEARP